MDPFQILVFPLFAPSISCVSSFLVCCRFVPPVFSGLVLSGGFCYVRRDLCVVVFIDPEICGHMFDDRLFRNENNRGIKENISMMNFYMGRMCIFGIKMKINEEELKGLMFFSVSI